MRESYYQSKIKKHLESKGCFVSKYHATGYGMKGHPDLFVSIPNSPYPISVYIEVKTPTGKVSSQQKMVHKLLEEGGYLVCVAVTVEDVEQFLKSVGICL